LVGDDRSNVHCFPYSIATPTGMIVDIVHPESYSAREFNNLVSQYLNQRDKNQLLAIKNQLDQWKINNIKLHKSLDGSSLMKEISTVSESLSEIATIGLEALEYLDKGTRPITGWKENTLKHWSEIPLTDGQTKIAVAKGIKQLVEATTK